MASSGLPSGWMMVPLGNLGEWGGGGTPSKSKSAFWTDGTVPWVSPKDMKFDVIESSQDRITQNAVENSSAKLYPPGTVLLVTRSAILLHTLPVAKAIKEVTVNQDLKALIPADCTNVDYLVTALRASAGHILNKCRKSGTTVCSIDFPKLKAYEIPVAPLNEQRRIVAKIEELERRSRAAKQALEAIPPLLERFRQSVLAAAFRGDLTKQWRRQNPEVEPASVLLQRIRQERRRRWEQDYLEKQKAKGKTPTDDRWKAKYQEPEPLDPTGLPELPEGWEWASMGEAFEVCVGATPSRKRPDYWGGSIPWVSSGEVAFCRISSTRETITEDGLKNSSTRLQPPGSLLIGMIGEGKTRGQVAILDIEACNNQNAAAIRVSMTPIPTEYVYRYLEGQYQATRLLGSGNNQQALNKTRVQAMVIPIAPLTEQEAICAELETLLSRADAINEFADNSSDKMHMLTQSILAKAFRGELVPQDPNDEPASALLERIRSQQKAPAKR